MIYKFPRAFTATLLIASLGACSQSREAPVHGDNYTDTRTQPTDDDTPTAPPTQVAEPTPTATADSNMTAAALPERAPPPAPDAQLMDDASTTGMTAHTSRSDQTDNQAAPAEPVETQ
jgi:hypothetical protein